MKKNSNIVSEINIRDNAVIPFFSKGNWSLYNLISHSLEYTGKASVKISSFSLSENAIRSFLNDMENNMITSMVLMFDFTIPKRKFDMMLFAQEVFSEIRLTNNHSKLTILDGTKNKAVILSSQNLTPNPRIECGVIFTRRELFEFYDKQFDKYFSDALPFNPYSDEN